MGTRLNETVRACGLGLGLACLLLATLPGKACNQVITWKADLTGGQQVPPASSRATACAEYVFDFVHEDATVTVDASTVRDVLAVELHAGYAGQDAPAEFTLYAAKDGPFPGRLRRTITPADLHPQPGARVRTFADFSDRASSGGVYVVVRTKSYPQGELRGQIQMRKETVYSAAGALHDPLLHARPGGTAAPAPAPPSPAPATSAPTPVGAARP